MEYIENIENQNLELNEQIERITEELQRKITEVERLCHDRNWIFHEPSLEDINDRIKTCDRDIFHLIRQKRKLEDQLNENDYYLK